jgi:1,4-alpha-glucan branching enzyme
MLGRGDCPGLSVHRRWFEEGYRVTDSATTTHTFALLAPYNEAAALIGSWDGWQEHPMERGEDHIFRATLDLPEGTHRYRLRVVSKSWFFPGEWRAIADPWARDIAPADGDEAGQAGDCAVIVVRDGVVGVEGDDYVWEHDDVPLPPNDMLIIYELHVGDFTGGEGDDGAGRYTDVIAKLPYLADLGITAIELMPVQETAGDYWGYLPKYFYAPETAYGTPSALKALIDACHGHGIRVVLDKVTNHAGSECPLAHIDHDYWFYHETTDEFQYGPKFNYEFHDEERDEYPARAFMLGALQHWVETYHVDGIRFDATGIMGNMEFLREASQAIWNKEGGLKPFVRIAEHLPLDISVVENDGPVDAAWFVDFAHQIASTLIGQPQDGHDPEDWEGILAALDPRRAGFTSSQHLVRYIASHDEERLLHRIHAAGIEGEEALRRMHFAITLLLTGYGYPMLYAGEEFGMDTPRVIGENKLAWSRLETPDGSGMHDHYRHLIWLRREHPALRGETLEIIHDDPEARVVAYHRWDGGGDRVVTVAHCAAEDEGGYTIPHWPTDGVWRDVLTDDLIEVHDGNLVATLGPWQTRVFTHEERTSD